MPSERELLEGFELFEARKDSCPYFDDGRERASLNFCSARMNPALYEALLAYGWRRCGILFYKNVCPSCSLCRPIRIPAKEFSPSRIQRRTASRNSDLEIEAGQAMSAAGDDFDLYRRYCAARHGEREQSAENFRFFLVDSPLPSLTLHFRKEGRLLGVAWTDILPDSLSAVYFAFDPESPRRSLGVFSILSHVGLCLQTGRSHLHLGFHIEGCRKMEYKTLYKPCETSSGDGTWRRVPE